MFKILPIHPQALAAALMAAHHLQAALPLNWEQLASVLPQYLNLHGRLECCQHGAIRVLLDVSHNEQSVQHLANYLARYKEKIGRSFPLYAVFSALRDKSLPQMIAPLLTFVDQWYLSALDSKRATSQAEFQIIFDQYQQNPWYYENPMAAFDAALTAARQSADPLALVIVFGSFLTVGQVMAKSSLKYLKQEFGG